MTIFKWLHNQLTFANIMGRSIVPLHEHRQALQIIEALLKGYDLISQIDDTGTGGYIEDIVSKSLTVQVDDIEKYLSEMSNSESEDEYE
jgi:hypothetical protein